MPVINTVIPLLSGPVIRPTDRKLCNVLTDICSAEGGSKPRISFPLHILYYSNERTCSVSTSVSYSIQRSFDIRGNADASGECQSNYRKSNQQAVPKGSPETTKTGSQFVHYWLLNSELRKRGSRLVARSLDAYALLHFLEASIAPRVSSKPEYR